MLGMYLVIIVADHRSSASGFGLPNLRISCEWIQCWRLWLGLPLASLLALYPDSRVVFLGDSGQGVTSTEFERVCNKNWNDQLPASPFGHDATTTPDTQVGAKLATAFLKDCFAQLWRRARRTPARSRRPDRQGVSTNT
jgi:hypothetical protein